MTPHLTLRRHPRANLLWRAKLLAAALPLAATEPLPAPPAGPFHTFVGMDVQVPFEGELRPMRRIVNRNRDAEVVVDGAIHHVAINRAEILRLKRGMKIGRASASVTDLEAVRAYSAANDPYRRNVQVQMAVQSQMAERMDAAQGQSLQALTGRVSSDSAADAATVAARDARTAAADMGVMDQANATPHYDYGELSHRVAGDLSREQYDALEATFAVSSPTPVADVDLVFVANYTAPGAPKDELRRLVYTRAIGAVGPEPREERVWVQGLPPGYELQETTVHLYSWGEELATNLSEKTVPLTETQALALLLAEHLHEHRDHDVPATPVWFTAPANFRALIDMSQLPPVARLHVDANGRVTDLHDEAGQPLRVQGLVRRVLTETRFLPALAGGEPVASELQIQPARFLQ